MPQYILLPRSVLKVSGEDARAFLQGLVTVDVLKLDAPRYAALLSPQGKFLHDFFLIPEGDAILMDVDSTRAEDLKARLLRYKLRAKVNIETLEDMRVFALLEEAAPQAIPDPRFAPMGWRMYASSAPQGSEAPMTVYETHRLKLGIPDGACDLIADRSFIIECGFEELHGVDFDKGCYVGQELTARTKFRANIRKGFYIVESDAELPAVGSTLMQGENEAGEMRSTSGNIGLAMLYHEQVEKDEKLMFCQQVIRASTPPWAAQKSTGTDTASGV